MDNQILAFYAKDMTIREIVATIKEMYDADVSPMLISKVTDACWMAKPSSAIYTIVYMDCIVVKVHHNGGSPDSQSIFPNSLSRRLTTFNNSFLSWIKYLFCYPST